MSVLVSSQSFYHGSHGVMDLIELSLWHPMGLVSSHFGVQQGGPNAVCPCLHKLVTSVKADDECLYLLLEA